MADTSTITQQQIAALLQQLGLGGYSNGGNGMGGQTVGGQPVTYDSATVNPNNTGAAAQGGYTDQMLEGTAMPTGFAQSTSVDGQGGSYGYAGGGMTSTANGSGWYPTSAKAASDFLKAQNAFKQNQANQITQLLNGQSGSTAAAPPDLSKVLSSASPNQGSTVNGGQGVYTPPGAAQAPGMAALQQAQAFNAAQMSLPSAPTGSTTAGALPSLAGSMGMGRGTVTGPATLGSQAPIVIPANQGAAVAPFRPVPTASGLPGTGASSTFLPGTTWPTSAYSTEPGPPPITPG
jgi:hypothetical protein